MKDKDRKKSLPLARVQFPVKRYGFLVIGLMLTSVFLVGLVFPGTAHHRLSFLNVGKDQSAYGFGIHFLEDSPILSGILEFGIDSGAKD